MGPKLWGLKYLFDARVSPAPVSKVMKALQIIAFETLVFCAIEWQRRTKCQSHAQIDNHNSTPRPPFIRPLTKPNGVIDD